MADQPRKALKNHFIEETAQADETADTLDKRRTLEQVLAILSDRLDELS